MKRFRFHFLNKKAIRKNKKEDGKLLKVPVPLGLAEFLVAKSIVQKVSVSLLLKHILTEWYKRQQVIEPMPELMEQITKASIFNWEDEVEKFVAQKAKNPTPSDFEDYKIQLKSFLQARGLGEGLMYGIIEELNNYYE